MRRALSAIGHVLVTAGLLILLFVAYQLWGTGILQARSQDDLRSQFEQELRTEDSPTSTSAPGTKSPSSTTPSSTTTTTPSLEIPPGGDAIAIIGIPKLGVSQVVVEGVDVADLRKGPGHYPTTPLPGQAGNAGIAGHRTTYGAPFGDLDQLLKGDEVVVRTVQGTFTYKVSKDPFVVSPDDGDVLLPEADPARPGTNLATLTLTTCHPKYSAAERLIVQATIELPSGATPLPAAVTPDGVDRIAGLDGESSSRSPAVFWGIIATLVGLAWWWLFHRYRHWYVWFAGAVPFLVVLFVFFTFFERLLPSNY